MKAFVVRPFGTKHDINFEDVHKYLIAPALAACDIQGNTTEVFMQAGSIRADMFQQLLVADIVVADISIHNANVFYELGIRHAAKPFTTVPILANVSTLPFDVALVRAVGYQLEDGKLTETSAQQLRTELAKRLRAAIDGVAANDSPLFQLIPNFPGIDLPDDVTETFKDRLQYLEQFRETLATARSQSTSQEKRDALLKIQSDLGDLKVVPRSVLIELMSSFRDAEAFEELVALYNAFPDNLKDYIAAKQQYALALNRRNKPGDREKALKLLDDLLKNRGADSETLGIKGRIHKDIYKEAAQAKKITAIAALDDAISAYTKGFESDPRDYYPGVNAINLLVQKGDEEALKEVERLLPLVSFAVARRGGASSSDYWDLATVLELACIGEDWVLASRVLPRAILAATASFQTATTIGNLRLLKQSRERTGREVTELEDILNELSARHIELRGEEKPQTG